MAYDKMGDAKDDDSPKDGLVGVCGEGSEILPIMFLKVVAVRFSIALIGLVMP